jgi:AraC family transcriptional regulator
MDVQLVIFPKTKVAVIGHFGPPELEHDTLRKLIAWRLKERLSDPVKYRSYGVHYTDPRTAKPSDHHVDFCLSVEQEVEPNSFGIVNKVIPGNRRALARDVGSRNNNKAAGLSLRGMAAPEWRSAWQFSNLLPLRQRRA